MGFLSTLADQVSSQYSIGENTTHSLDTVVDGQNVKYGSLGDFANKIDQSATRSYNEEGFLRRDPYNADPKQLEILMQEPNATVLVKKRMFSSIAENFRPDFMDKDEKLYYKTIKILFDNKCRQIAALEKLSKIQKITSAVGKVDEQLMPIIFSLSDALNTDDGSVSSLFNSDAGAFAQTKDISTFTKTMDRLRVLYGFNTTNPYTTWIKDSTNLFQTQFGEGTGVIEITNFTNLSTNTTVNIANAGTFSLNISDPYEAMVITEWDIEKAISDATNSFYNHKSYQFGLQTADQVINDQQSKLNQLRKVRGVGAISIKVNPNTILGKRVTAIFDSAGLELPFVYDSTGGTGFPGLGGAGNSVTVAPEYLKDGAAAGAVGLDTNKQSTLSPGSSVRKLIPDSELTVFQALIVAIFNKIQLEANANNAFQTSNKDTNYVRRKMKFNFSGQLIIQPMDVVHIYVSTKSRYDDKLLSGLNNMFTGNGILQNLNKTKIDFKTTRDLLFKPSNIQIQAEKSAFVGPDFPNYLWAMIRTQFITEKEGVSVFGGIVEDAHDRWSDGKFTVSVSGKDNTAYFDQGKVNFKPGADTYNGAIFDPLTPFKTSFDTVTSNFKDENPVLLDENKYLLGSAQDKSSLLKFKLGPFSGQTVNSENYIQDKSIDAKSKRVTRVFYAPDGLVYKWKEGIGVFTQFGDSVDFNSPNQVGNPNTYDEPFAGQDIMNVLSLLITGMPYNFATYWKFVKNPDGFGKDPQSQQDGSHAYFLSLTSDLAKRNSLWGNFIPFKNLVVDDESFSKALMSQFTITRRNQDLDQKIQKLAELNRQAQLFGAPSAFAENSIKFNDKFVTVRGEAYQIADQISRAIKDYAKEDKSYLVTVGDETSFDFGDFLDSSKLGKQASDPNIRRALRRQVNFLTRRMSYNVRANQDKNLFIVDDYYDKDYDIAAYSQKLADGIALYNNEFNDIRQKVTTTANLLNLEVFCDTQGHIRIRPPQYNRMPSSIFYRMMYLKQTLNVQVFPQFLDDIFNDQIDALKKRIEIIELQIRLDCALFGYNDDASATSFILSEGSTDASGAMTGSGIPFGFLSDQFGNINGIEDLSKVANPDAHNDQIDQSLRAINGQATSTKDTFTNFQRFFAIQNALTTQSLNAQGYSIDQTALEGNTRVDDLISLIQTKSGQRINKYDYIVTNDAGIQTVELPTNSQVDVFKITAELSDKIKDRQKAIKLFNNAIKNATEFKSLDSDKDITSKLLTPGTFGNSNIPEVFEHMIEDESYDDYGPGSGSRYIIKRAQIKDIQINNAQPDFTAVQVNGVLNTFAPSAGEGVGGGFPTKGNGLVSAVGVDYDMWRNYGFKNVSPIDVPFLSDPESQCAPYAAMILSRARKNILRGTVTISGNEYMQPGEVVFIEGRNMLFYVNSVRHNFTFGSAFTTTLDLTYGHTAGDYIPTTMDFIGKFIYNNRDIAGYVVQRQSTSNNEKSLGVVLRDKANNTVINNKDTNSIKNSYSSFNEQTIDNILYTVASTIHTNNVQGNNVMAKVELRLYKDNNNEVNTDLQTIAETVRNMLIEGGGEEGGKISFGKNQTIPNPRLPKDSVKMISETIVNMDDSNDRRSPSQKALDAARNIMTVDSSSKGPGSSSLNATSLFVSPDSTKASDDAGDNADAKLQKDQIRKALFSYVIDCWISFENVETDLDKQSTTGGS